MPLMNRPHKWIEELHVCSSWLGGKGELWKAQRTPNFR